jgi:hypothetical protein
VALHVASLTHGFGENVANFLPGAHSVLRCTHRRLRIENPRTAQQKVPTKVLPGCGVHRQLPGRTLTQNTVSIRLTARNLPSFGG